MFCSLAPASWVRNCHCDHRGFHSLSLLSYLQHLVQYDMCCDSRALLYPMEPWMIPCTAVIGEPSMQLTLLFPNISFSLTGRTENPFLPGSDKGFSALQEEEFERFHREANSSWTDALTCFCCSKRLLLSCMQNVLFVIKETHFLRLLKLLFPAVNVCRATLGARILILLVHGTAWVT